MPGLPPEFLRMFGGVAGNMDTIASSTLQETPSGQFTFSPSTKYFNQVKQLHGMVDYSQQPMQQAYYPPQQPQLLGYTPQEPEEENSMDISKYIGKKQQKAPSPQPNSQVEALKVALKPLNEQLEKVCILLGMIYQKLEAVEAPQEEVEGDFEAPVLQDDSQLPLEEQIAKAEAELRARPKAPTTEEIQAGEETVEVVE